MSESFPRDKIEVRLLDVALGWPGLVSAAKGVVGRFHLLEPMHDGGMEFMLIGEMSLVIAARRERLWTERAAVASG
jgi:hypothetical protein